MDGKEKNNSLGEGAKSALLNEGETWGEFFRSIFYAFLIAISVRTFILQPFSIPSESMLKNLMVGDFLLVNKMSYGYSKHSLPFSLPIIPDRIFSDDVERGDVVVFRLPRDPDIYYIKRIVGVPGDKIQMINGELHLNGAKLPRIQIEDYVRTNEYGREERFEQFEEVMPSGKTYVTLNREYVRRADDTQVFIVPEGHYFAMGDHRDNSLDSRWPSSEGVGFVPFENIIGKATWLTLSFDNHSALWEFWKWFPEERRDRFFTTIN
ncbi:signal peptidase I [Pseudemcibacter aquimaris]|uniref:signal peptidase I n=1 Tax=Pseudemcibacter aquimaris TaxID=2857064 RepID=UPI0020110933|nr:signal peptidase I [Pseudemcibacter aquimaris]MCC3860661.1 signal peptidase I [Pseudemcibacter aquimaris]WDU59481.1 signal peptidase I [Pseudemcibacter aquimaris]